MQNFLTSEVPDYIKVRQISYGLENSSKYNYTMYNLESEYIPNFNLKTEFIEVPL